MEPVMPAVFHRETGLQLFIYFLLVNFFHKSHLPLQKGEAKPPLTGLYSSGLNSVKVSPKATPKPIKFTSTYSSR
jgi:hypothetical protein